MENRCVKRSGKVDFVEVADNIFAALTQYYGLSWANAGFINKGKGLVIDTFADLSQAQELKDFVTKIHGKNPGYVVNTHPDMDHLNGNQLFIDSDIIAHQNFFNEYDANRFKYWQMVQKTGKQSGKPGLMFLAENIEGLDFTGITPVSPNITFDKNMVIQLDDMRVELKYIGPAHTKSDVLVWLPKDKVLFAGDVLFEGVVGWSEEGVKGWVGALEYIYKELKPNVVVLGHGRICDAKFVADMRDYFQNIIDTVDKYYDEDITALELAKKVDIRDYLHWFQPERLFVTVSTIVKERRGQTGIKDWEYLAPNMAELKDYYDKLYGKRS